MTRKLLVRECFDVYRDLTWLVHWESRLQASGFDLSDGYWKQKWYRLMERREWKRWQVDYRNVPRLRMRAYVANCKDRLSTFARARAARAGPVRDLGRRRNPRGVASAGLAQRMPVLEVFGEKKVMKEGTLLHAHALALTTVLLDLVEDCIRPEERRDALEEFYSAAKSALARYEQARWPVHRPLASVFHRSKN